MEDLFKRSELNPIIRPSDMPYQVNTVFNAGAADLGDEVVLLMRVESYSGRSHFTVARSKNGETDWQIEENGLMHPSEGYAVESYGLEDCRITWMEDLQEWGLAYTAYSQYGAAIGVATTKDFKSVKRLGVAFPPDNKDAALFPKKINGYYAMLHRPAFGGGNIWIGYSPDLVYWGRSRLVLPVRGGPWWDGLRVGAGIPPIETEKGWLLIYHGVKDMPGGPIYRVGGALLDLEKPHKLIARSRRWLLSPEKEYERVGDVPNVVFPCGGVVREGELWLYYGSADSSISLAKANISDILEIIEKNAIAE